jgi:flagellar hook assembly protein FlgD
LSQNYPNPFNGSTNVSFSVASQSDAILKIYDVLGKEVKTLFEKEAPAGDYTVRWDGTNVAGEKVSSGIYFVRLMANEFHQTIKLLLMQ